MASAKQVARRLKKLSNKIPEVVNRFVQQLAATIDTNLVLVNPVDTGRSRANWLIGINDPLSNNLNIQEEEGTPGQQEFDSGIALNEQTNLKARRPEDTVFIVNNTSYIEQLNNGSSFQAPANFVEQSVMLGLQSFKRRKIVATASRGI